MDDLFKDPWSRLLLPHATVEGLARAGLFLLVAARLAGLLCIGMFLGRTMLTWPARIGLIVLFALIVTPTLPLPGDPLDQVELVRHEDDHRAKFIHSASIRQIVGHNERSNSPLHWFSSPVSFVVKLLCEIGLGLLMGFGVAIFLSGLRLGSEWLDRHSGLGLGSVMNPETGVDGSVSSSMLWILGITAILLMDQGGGHLLFARIVLESFHSLPVGTSIGSQSLIDLIQLLLRQSLLLGLRIAMPLVVTMSLFDLTLAFISRSCRCQLLPAAYAARVLAGLLILFVTWPGVADSIAITVLETLQLSSESLFVGESSQLSAPLLISDP